MYIRVNLLPQELRQKKALINLDVKTVLVVFAVAAAVGLAGYSVLLQRKLSAQNTRAEVLRREEASLQGMVALRAEVATLKKRAAERVEIIQSLTADSDLRFDMLKHINGIIPENLWLLSINEMGKSGRVAFAIEGMSYSKRDISRFLDGLQHYKKFSSVALESITPSPLEVRDAFQFAVQVELSGTSAMADAAGDAGKPGKKKPAGKPSVPDAQE